MTARKWTIGVLIAAAIVALVGWMLYDRYWIYIPRFMADLRDPIRPNQPILWQRGPDESTVPPSERPPNIVLIVADDLGWNNVTFYGGGVANGTVPTPNIDSIAQQGVHLTNSYSGSATCAPSRAAIMTGRYPTRSGFELTPMPPSMAQITARLGTSIPGEVRRPFITHFEGQTDGEFGAMSLPSSEVTIAEVLRDAGYHTVHMGKWHLGDVSGSTPNDQGFDESLDLSGLLYAEIDDPDVVASRQAFDPLDRFFWASGRFAVTYNDGPKFKLDIFLTEYFTREAINVIESNRNRPFILYLAHWAPHTPLQALKSDYDALSHIEDHTLRVYAASIRALDRGVGQVLEALREYGLEENTIVIFTSDNGGAHYVGLSDINKPYRGWKATFFGGGIRVPFFVKWPAVITPGGEMDGLAHHSDLFPTLAAVAGASLPDDRVIDGENLLPYLTGEASGDVHDTLFWRSGHYQAVISNGWKLQVVEEPGRTWLFDLNNDPLERSDLSAIHPEKVAELEALLAAHNAEQAASLWPSLIEMPVPIDKSMRERESADDEYIYWPN